MGEYEGVSKYIFLTPHPKACRTPVEARRIGRRILMVVTDERK
jgi:hypothetical protein